MASLDDIPETLRSPDQLMAFAAWLAKIPLPQHATRDLITQWELATGAHLSFPIWKHLLDRSELADVL